LAAALISAVVAATGFGQVPMPSPMKADGPPPPEHVKILQDAKAVEGVIPLFQKGNSLFAELSASNYGTEYIVLISIARGIGQGPLLGGMSWGFGDDWVWTFRKVDDRVFIVRKNVRFKAAPGSPEASAVKNAYTDSVMFSLQVITKGPKGGDLVDLTQVFMSDLPQIQQVLAGFAFSPNKSTWESIKGFKDNVEIQVGASYVSGGQQDIDTVADSRGVTLSIHYSISKLPSTGYQPRMADDRIGYFNTVVMDYSKKSDRDRFQRYVNRWHLEKADPAEKLSPPKQPIIFWLEKTVPFKYRKPIRDGILEWNKAYEKAGFLNAIEVRQQPDDATWDPEDINYNTFRWITASAGFAMGPSRVNPYTGQILDADIIFDADFLQSWKDEYDTYTPAAAEAITGGSLDPKAYRTSRGSLLATGPGGPMGACLLGSGMGHQLALGQAAIAAADPKVQAETLEKLIMQGLKEVTMHEVGHTLGLRHNFIASTQKNLKDINDPEKTKDGALVASVMDYSPVNIVPKGQKQGDFYNTSLGPYDVWAIEYGYTPFGGGTSGETKDLEKIAVRSGEPGLAYLTDENTRGIDPDPHSNRFDLGDDLLEYAKTRSQLVKELMPGLVDRMTKEGEDFVQARRAFNVLVATQGQSMFFASRYIGGLHESRSHKGDKGGKLPISLIDPVKQRETLKLLEDEVFGEKAFNFPPEIYNQLGSSKWSHWGVRPTDRPDFPVHDFVQIWQTRVLDRLMSPLTLERIHDAELKVSADKEAFTSAELIERTTKAIFSEVEGLKEGEYSNRKPAISSLRRNLQRYYLKKLSTLALGQSVGAPEDCQTIAYAELSSLRGRIAALLNRNNLKLDSYSRAHLMETGERIQKVLDSRLTVSTP